MPAAARLGDKAQVDADAHGCPACPHPGVGPIVTGSANVTVNGKPAARLDDLGIHAVCCGPNNFTIKRGSPTVYVNGKPIARMQDTTQHCGGSGPIIEGSPDVLIDDGAGAQGLGSFVMNALAIFRQTQTRPARPQQRRRTDTHPGHNLATNAAAPPAALATQFAQMRVLDDASRAPLSNVQLSLVLADGSQVTRTTDSDGIVRIDPAPRGSFAATSAVAGKQISETLTVVAYRAVPPGSSPPAGGSGAAPAAAGAGQSQGQAPAGPWVLAQVEEHRVRTGETLASLAKRCHLTWAQLAHFNWGTSSPKEINEHLRVDVGCTKKTKNGANYMFDDSDEPGIVYLPMPWRVQGLEGYQGHEVRVRRITPAPLPFGLCCDDAGDPIAGKAFVILDAGKEVFSGETDADGLIRAPFPHDPRYEVWFPQYGTKRKSRR